MIDTHAHINPQVVKEPDKMIDEINNNNHIHRVINVGLDYETSKYAVEMSNENCKFYSAIGIHPLYEGNVWDLEDLFKLDKYERIVAVGETGIDSFKDYEIQVKKFHDSIDFANEHELPVIIHSNNMNQACINVLRIHKVKEGFVFHCFQPDLNILNQIQNMDGYISLGTPITRPNAKKSLEVLSKVDINRLLIELDWPFMSQNAYEDGKRVFNKMKQIRKINSEDLEATLDENAKRLFKKMKY